MKKINSKEIERALDREDWAGARRLLLDELKNSPDDHWLLTRLGTTFHEERQYTEALRWSERALKEAPACPLVLWDYAGALDMLGREKEAIEVWRKIIERGVSALAEGECGEGVRWAKSLINDCRYRIALSSQDLGKREQVIHYLKAHLKHRSPGLPSLYPLRKVCAKLKEWGADKAASKKLTATA